MIHASHRIPARPRSWYIACRSADLAPGQVRTWSAAGRDVVLFRGRGNHHVRAVTSACVHMGTHLGHGEVVGDRLRCPLHHWQFDGEGVCRLIPAASPSEEPDVRISQPTLPVVERLGSIFVYLGSDPRCEPPAFSRTTPEDVRVVPGRPVRLRCPWYAITSNGFDMQHFQTVHGRALVEPPRLERLDADRIQLRYTSRVTSTATADRLIKLISGDRIEVVVTCFGGTVVTVESDLGRTRSFMMMSVQPVEEGAEIRPLFGISRSTLIPADAVRLGAARWLYSAFMKKDVAFMNDMHFRRSRAGPVDPILHAFLDYLEEQPADLYPCADEGAPHGS